MLFCWSPGFYVLFALLSVICIWSQTPVTHSPASVLSVPKVRLRSFNVISHCQHFNRDVQRMIVLKVHWPNILQCRLWYSEPWFVYYYYYFKIKSVWIFCRPLNIALCQNTSVLYFLRIIIVPQPPLWSMQCYRNMTSYELCLVKAHLAFL